MNFAKILLCAVFKRNSCGKCDSHHQLRGDYIGANRSQPGTEKGPHELGNVSGQIRKQSLRDNASVNENMVGVEFSLHGIAVV